MSRLGVRVHARFFCAICGANIGHEHPRVAPLGPRKAMVNVCDDCATEPAREKRGPERAYEGAGPMLSTVDTTKGMRRMMGDAQYEAESVRCKRSGLAPAPQMSQGEVDIKAHFYETGRRIATTSNQKRRPPQDGQRDQGGGAGEAP